MFLEGQKLKLVPLLRTGKVVINKTMALIRQMSALHSRVALQEMTRHEFLGGNYRKERTTFADGTTVTVDWDAKTVKIEPEL